MKSISRLIFAACLGAIFSMAGFVMQAQAMDCGPGMSGMSGMGGTCKDDTATAATGADEEMGGMSGMDCGPGMSGMSGMGGTCN